MKANENLNLLPCNNPVVKSPNFPVSSTLRSTVKEETSLGGKYFQIVLCRRRRSKEAEIDEKRGISFVLWPISFEQLSS